MVVAILVGSKLTSEEVVGHLVRANLSGDDHSVPQG